MADVNKTFLSSLCQKKTLFNLPKAENPRFIKSSNCELDEFQFTNIDPDNNFFEKNLSNTYVAPLIWSICRIDPGIVFPSYKLQKFFT